ASGTGFARASRQRGTAHMRYGRVLAIVVAGLTLMSDGASAQQQDCFLFFCRQQRYQQPYNDPAYQQPYGQQPDPRAADPRYGYPDRTNYPPGPNGERFAVPDVPPGAVNPAFMRTTVRYAGNYAPGTIVIDTPNHYLYLVQGGGQAMRYGI